MSAPEKYRPSNGWEGEEFTHKWCHNCIKWDDGRCPISLAVLIHPVSSPKYPAEWIYSADDEEGQCTAFLIEEPEPVDDKTADMFGGVA